MRSVLTPNSPRASSSSVIRIRAIWARPKPSRRLTAGGPAVSVWPTNRMTRPAVLSAATTFAKSLIAFTCSGWSLLSANLKPGSASTVLTRVFVTGGAITMGSPKSDVSASSGSETPPWIYAMAPLLQRPSTDQCQGSLAQIPSPKRAAFCISQRKPGLSRVSARPSLREVDGEAALVHRAARRRSRRTALRRWFFPDVVVSGTAMPASQLDLPVA